MSLVQSQLATFVSRAPWARSARVRFAQVPLPVMILIVTLMIPSDVSIMAGGLRLSPYRIVLLLAFFPAVLRLVSNRAGKIIAPDWCMLFFAVWSGIAVIKHHGAGEGIEKGGIFAVESLGAYLVARAWVTDVRKFRAVVKLLACAVIASLIFTLPEMLTGQHILREFFAALMGGNFSSPVNERLGLTRAYGSFDHPILNGVFCGSVLGMAFYALAKSDTIRITDGFRGLLVIMAAFTSVSSGAAASAVVQIGLIAYDRFTRLARFVQGRWWLLTTAMLVNYFAIDALSNRSGMRVILSYLTFSPGTAYNRLMIWEFGKAEVIRHPVWGIGFNEWERPSWMSGSMDNFWLVHAVRYGLPAFLAMAAAVLILARNAGKGLRGDAIPDHRRARRGWIVSLVAISVAGATVHFWNALAVYFFVLLGLGACLRWDPKEGAWVRQQVAAALPQAEEPEAARG